MRINFDDKLVDKICEDFKKKHPFKQYRGFRTENNLLATLSDEQKELYEETLKKFNIAEPTDSKKLVNFVFEFIFSTISFNED